MDDGKQVVNHFLLWRQRFLINHDDLATVPARKMVEQVEAEANESILVGDENSLNLTTLDALNQREETLALEVHAAADFLNPLVNSNRASPAILLHRRHLRLQVVALSSATDATVHDCRSRLRPAAKHRPNIGLVKVPMSGR